MLAKILSNSLNGLEGFRVEIEVDINAGIPCCEVVGLPDAAVKEAKERVRSAIKNSGYNYPLKRMIINLAPANLKKEGPLFDLAMAIGLLVASEQIECKKYKEFSIIGELSLDGGVRHISGLMPLLISGLQEGINKFIVPYENMAEASYIQGIEVYACKNLREVVEFLSNHIELEAVAPKEYGKDGGVIEDKYGIDFNEVKGQYAAKRALEIAVCGGHNVLMIGPPGAGKTMLAKCIPTIMPRMTFDEAIEVTKIHSIAGVLDKKEGIVKVRPFRSPHHTATIPSLTGGGANSRPGEISMAHNGVLFLDEMPEYNRRTLEALRQPLEDGKVTVARVAQTVEYPADFMLIASMNPCPCGNYGSSTQQCQCSSSQIHKYVSKLSGPLLDRIDLHIEADNITYEEFRTEGRLESSSDIRKRVDSVRAIQRERFKGSKINSNAQMTPSMIKKYCQIDADSEKLLENAYIKLGLSARGTTRILKVARTIADIDNQLNISCNNIAEAIQYRSLDRKYWL